jgi:diaminohydroxyphosphoribosylaminopyrimidine deaminase/5-amino-6-(5-phosphoribosylamino)uracil reductase
MAAPADPDADARHMAHALGLAARGLGRVWPNPAVGCVIVAQGGRVVGRGHTAPGGRPHAEALALAEAGPAARGATAYVTLEPCAHPGRGPACSASLAASGVARVVTAMTDPDPRVNGQGHATLRAAGVTVTEGVLGEQARALQRGFLTRLATGRPMVTLKLATSLDGRIATAAGESRWITGPQSRARVHLMRARHDAVMVGAGTVRADDPDLTVRGLGPLPQPVRVVVSASLDLPPASRLAATARDTPVWIVHGPAVPPAATARWTDAGARLIAVPAAPDGTLDPAAALSALGAAGLTRVLCEGGGRLAAALLAAGLVDEIALFSAGLSLGADGTPAIGLLGLTHLADAPRFRLHAVTPVGPDSLSTWSAVPPGGA